MQVKAAVPPQLQRTAKPTAYGHFDGMALGAVNGTALKNDAVVEISTLFREVFRCWRWLYEF